MATVAGLLLVAAAATLVGVHQHLKQTEQQLGVAQTQEQKRSFEEGTTRALCLVNTTNLLQDHLVQGKELCENTLNLYGVLDNADWENHPRWQGLNLIERGQLAKDVRELLLLLAWGDIALDANLIQVSGIKPVTHFFSN